MKSCQGMLVGPIESTVDFHPVFSIPTVVSRSVGIAKGLSPIGRIDLVVLTVPVIASGFFQTSHHKHITKGHTSIYIQLHTIAARKTQERRKDADDSELHIAQQKFRSRHASNSMRSTEWHTERRTTLAGTSLAKQQYPILNSNDGLYL